MMRPSFPGAFVVEVTATTLLIQIILPSAPPVICKARIVEVDRLSISAVWCAPGGCILYHEGLYRFSICE